MGTPLPQGHGQTVHLVNWPNSPRAGAMPQVRDDKAVRTTASILHLDLDAFFAAVEQRDKPSLRGKPVVVGGIGNRGVVATASYEARAYGARSAMSTSEARRRCPPGTAFLFPRGEAYRRSSRVVMDLLRELSPVVEQVSVDEAYVDLAAQGDHHLSVEQVRARVEELLATIEKGTGGLTASAGVGSSKMIAKIASDMHKPRGLVIVEPGDEEDFLAPLPVRALGGVGPATADRLRTFGVEKVSQLRRMTESDLVSIFGNAHGSGLFAIARAQDDREVVTEREAKSISAEETFDVDVVDRAILREELARLTDRVSARLAEHGAFARTVTIKVRHHDFSTFTRSITAGHPTDDPATLLRLAIGLLDAHDVSDGLRLLGFGVSGFVAHAQAALDMQWPGEEDLPTATATAEDDIAVDQVANAWGSAQALVSRPAAYAMNPGDPVWRPGQDVTHEEYGDGWVWGSGRGVVTVRFEGPRTGPGKVRTFRASDEALRPADPPDWTGV